MNISTIDVAMIAQGLKVRQKLHRPTLLFLGARAGALFHSQTLYDELLNQYSSTSFDQVEKFQACIRLLTQGRLNDTEIHSILLRSLPDVFVQNIDRYVAALAKLNFFRLIVTTNINAGLEAALSWIGLHKNTDFDVFIPGADSGSSIPSLSSKHASDESPLFTLVKLYGELAVGHYNLKHRDKLLEGNTQTYQQLRSMRNWNILMVGFDPVWDSAIVPLLFPCTGKLWYVNEETPSYNSEIFKYLQFRNAQCLLGVKGSSEKFLLSLYQHIVGSAPLPSLTPQEESLPAQSYQSVTSLLTGNVKQAIVHTRFPSIAQYKVDVLIIASTRRELTALLKEQHVEVSRYTIQERTCYDLGKVVDASVSLIQADETGNALDTLGEQIQELSPACIIILGTAWGFNYKGQDIGNLLVSDRVLIQDVKRENLRSTSTPKLGTDPYIQIGIDQKVVPAPLLNLFKNGSIILNTKTKGLGPVTFGPIFSSIEASDRETTFHYVSRVAPDTIGIETGNITLFPLAQSYQENCLQVKVVSALVDVDEAVQQDNMPDLDHAAKFILDAIALGGFHDPLAQ